MPLIGSVAALMLGLASNVVMPRYRRLASGDIREKTPGEVVTSVDVEVEKRLSEGLSVICPSATVIGEEAVSDDPGLLDRVGNGQVWLVDPVDGTANYAAGRPPFGMMVALLEDGLPMASWILDPLDGRLFTARRGKGGRCNGRFLRACPAPVSRPVAALGTHFLPENARARVHAHAERHLQVVPVPFCAAESYARLALGADNVALFQRSLPWDHAAGALLVEEVGGRVTHWDGSSYRAGGPGSGILAASSPAAWDLAAAILLGPECGLDAVGGIAA